MKKYIILAGITIATITGCKKETTTSTEPIFNISSPTNGKEYELGDTVFIKATITAKEELHGYMVTLKNSTVDSVLMDYDQHTDATSQTIDTFWINNVTTHSDMKLMITAVKDHLGNTVTDTISFHCHPM